MTTRGAQDDNMKPIFFKTPEAFRAWLEKNHEKKTEQLVGFYKVGSGKPSITWPQSVDEALSFGWIDGVRKSIDDESYTIRFTPRKPTSIWSAVNMKRVKELIKEGRMRPAGLAAWNRRDAKKSAIYSYEREHAQFDAETLAKFKADKKAWEFFEKQPPGYRKQMTARVVDAKRPETREKRLGSLMDACRKGVRIDLLTGKPTEPRAGSSS